jgi:hypothetical protein
MLAFFQGRCRTRPAAAIKSWNAFAAAIKAASPIGQLLVYSHGAPGQLRFGTEEYGLEQDNIRPLFLGRCQATLKTHVACNQETVAGSAFCKTHRPEVAKRWVGPHARVIDFEGCTVGQRPASLVKFAKLLGASSISGFTWFHVGGTSPGIPIPKGATVEVITALMLPIQKYLFAGQPSAAEYAIKAKAAGFTATPWIEYFIEGTADLSKGVPGGAVARSQVKVRSITVNQASALEDEYDASLKLPCEQVVVIL